MGNIMGLSMSDNVSNERHIAKEPYKIDDILKKRPIILRSLLIVDTPYVSDGWI